jgi:hypothetical protein
LATDRRDAYDAVSRVGHSFERVDDDLVNNCTVEPGGRPTAHAQPRQTETWSVLEGAYACGSASPAMAAVLDTVTVPRSPLSPTGADVDLIVGVLPEHPSKVVT